MRRRNVSFRWRKLCVLIVCGGAHGTGDWRCPVRERQVEVARVRVAQKVSYAEAVKRVVEEDGYRVRDPERIPVSRQRLIEIDGKNMCFSKVGFLAFIAMVFNCTAEIGIARFAGGVEWWCSVLPDLWTGVGLDVVNSGMGCFFVLVLFYFIGLIVGRLICPFPQLYCTVSGPCVAQLVEHGACNARVVGSFPTGRQYENVCTH
ncbi:hypothetical protein J4Q44_G00070180 [Coregonus suidteri]|uniref:Uncharacterized protein n=1 Tax=Coregonus suidteri TaxID=861788 RepID=A0AAN8MBE0_9TELE